MEAFKLLDYTVMLIKDITTLNTVVNLALAENIGILAFDTETNTPINMAKKDTNYIDIMHDEPFLIQFGWGKGIFLIDLRIVDGDEQFEMLQALEALFKHAKLCTAHNAKFDIHMLMNIGMDFEGIENIYDNMSLLRLTNEAKTDREGGIPMALKPVAKRLLGSAYSDADHRIWEDLEGTWKAKLKDLATQLKPYGISRAKILELLKDVTAVYDVFETKVRDIYTKWESEMYVSYADVEPYLLYQYGAIDVIILLEFAKMLMPVLKDRDQVSILKREMALVMPLVRMERTGYTVDKQYLIRCKQALIFEVQTIRERNFEISGVRLTCNQHAAIKDMLKEKFGYILTSTASPEMQILINTDTSMPEEVKTYIENIMYLRTLEKWISTYINSMLFKLNRNGLDKVYTMYNPNGAVSGRFTSNFQQFPKNPIYSKVGDFELFHPRKMFVASKEFPTMGFIDYSQIELRLQAEYTYYATNKTGDVNMLRAYMPFECYEKGGLYYQKDTDEEWCDIDLHTQSASTAFPDVDIKSDEFKKLRNIGKRVNFALIYGGSLARIQSTLADTDPQVVALLYNGFHARFKGVATYGNWVRDLWRSKGYVPNLLGRRYYISDMRDVYKLNNYLIQGSAADIIKLAIIAIDKMLLVNKCKSKLQGCIHDEICIVIAPGEEYLLDEVKRLMEQTCKTFVPLVAEIETSTTTWAAKKEV